MRKKHIRKEVEKMQITIPEEIIHQFIEDKEEAMRQLITYFLNAVMEEEARIQSGALPYERTSTRKAHRNGYRNRIKACGQ